MAIRSLPAEVRGAVRRVRAARPGAAMLDFFTIFSKGGLVLWCFQGVRGPASAATAPVNALIRSVLLQVRRGGGAAAEACVREGPARGGERERPRPWLWLWLRLPP